MKSRDEFERKLHDVADAEAVEHIMKKAARAEELSEDTLARYYSGTLSEEEMEALGPLLAFSDSATSYLAEIQEDLEEASEFIATTSPAEASWFEKVSDALRSLWTVHPRGVLAGAAVATLALVMLIGPVGRELLRRDLDPYTPDLALVAGQVKSVMRLPNGQMVDRVADDWPLGVPTGTVSQVDRFRWAPVRGASWYHLTVYAQDGKLALRALDLSGSQYELGTSERHFLVPGATYTWMVEAAGNDGSVLCRAIGSFTRAP